jgi:hypothetical protein
LAGAEHYEVISPPSIGLDEARSRPLNNGSSLLEDKKIVYMAYNIYTRRPVKRRIF